MSSQFPDAALSNVGSSKDTRSLAFRNVVRTSADLETLEAAWNSLATKTGIPMEQYTWMRACTETLLPSRSLRVAVAAQNDVPIAIMPLYVSRVSGRLEIPGARELGEPFDAIYSDPDAAAILAEAVVRLRSPLCLQRMDANSPFLAALEQALKGRTVTFKRPAPSYPFIPLHEGWKDPESQLTSRRRSDLRRSARHAEKIGRLRFEMLSPTADELQAVLDCAFETEAKSWKGATGSALALNQRVGSFFRNFAKAACDKRQLRVSFLRIGDRVAAMQIAVELGGRYWLLKMGYDHEFSKSSPGMLLIAETVRESAERGLQSYELLGTIEPWTHVWTESERPCVSLYAYPLRPGGLADLATDATLYVWNRTKTRFKSKK